MQTSLKHFHRQYKRIDYHDRTMLLSAGSFVTNAVIGFGKLAIGLTLLSPLFIATAIYYLFLCTARGQVLWRFRQTRNIEDAKEQFDRQFSVFRHCGFFICLLGVSYLFVCMRMYYWSESTAYPYYIIYGIAAIAFYKISLSIYGMVVSRRIKNPLFSAMKIISFIDASVSIVAVQCALLTMEESAETATQSSALFGTACSVVFIVIGIFMLLKKKVYPESSRQTIAHCPS